MSSTSNRGGPRQREAPGLLKLAPKTLFLAARISSLEEYCVGAGGRRWFGMPEKSESIARDASFCEVGCRGGGKGDGAGRSADSSGVKS